MNTSRRTVFGIGMASAAVIVTVTVPYVAQRRHIDQLATTIALLQDTNVSVVDNVRRLQEALDESKAMAGPWRAHLNAAQFRGEVAAPESDRVLLELLEVPKLPKPKRSEYADGVYLAKARVIGTSADPARRPVSLDREVMVAMWAFRDRIGTPESALRAGVHVDCALIPAERMPQSILGIQRFDEVEDFDLDLYYAAGVRAGISGVVEIDPTASDEAFVHRATSRREDAEHIDELLAAHGGSWERWHAALAPLRVEMASLLEQAGGDLVRRGVTYRRKGHEKLLEFTPPEGWPTAQVAMLSALRDQLAQERIDLIAVPVPEKEIVAIDTFASDAPGDGLVAPYRLMAHRALLEADIEVIDVAPALRKAGADGAEVYYGGSDHHLADAGIRAVAAEIARRLRRYDIPPRWTRLVTWERSLRINRVFAPKYGGAVHRATCVGEPGYKPLDMGSGPTPVLLTGDSLLSFPTRFNVESASLAAHLAAETGLGSRVQWYGGGAPQMMRHLARMPRNRRKGVRVCVFVFLESELQRNDGQKSWEVATMWDE